MNRLLEQCCVVKLCVKLGKTGSEARDRIKTAYGRDAMGHSSVLSWHKLFREGREPVGTPFNSKKLRQCAEPHRHYVMDCLTKHAIAQLP